MFVKMAETSLGALQIGGEKVNGISRDDGLVRSAAYDAILSSNIELKMLLLKKGYILEKSFDCAILKYL